MNLIARIVKIDAVSEKTTESLKNIKMSLADMEVLIKNVTTYQKTNCTKLYTTQIFGCQIQNIIIIHWFNTFISVQNKRTGLIQPTNDCLRLAFYGYGFLL